LFIETTANRSGRCSLGYAAVSVLVRAIPYYCMRFLTELEDRHRRLGASTDTSWISAQPDFLTSLVFTVVRGCVSNKTSFGS